MTLRDSSVRNRTPKSDRSLLGRLRDKRRRKDRRLLTESLEQRQLLAGPDLIGIQPNEGALIRGGDLLTVSPKELVFRFDDKTDLTPNDRQRVGSLARVLTGDLNRQRRRPIWGPVERIAGVPRDRKRCPWQRDRSPPRSSDRGTSSQRSMFRSSG